MRKTFRVLIVGIVAGSLCLPVAARAQSHAQPGVDLPQVDVAAAATFRQVAGSGRDRNWTGPGLALTIDRNAGAHLAAAAQVETELRHAATVLGGAQVSTGFYYGSGRDPMPGRFFARVLAGVKSTPGEMHPASQVGVGADVLLSRTRPVGLRGEVGYDLIAGAIPTHNGRVAIGLLFGPHLRAEGSGSRRARRR
jgi:hypothetical protein